MWWTASVVVNISGFLLDAVPARSLKCPSLETELQPIGTRFSLPLQGPPKNMLLSNASSYESFGNVGLWFKKGRQTDHDDANCKEDDVVDLVDYEGFVVVVPALTDVVARNNRRPKNRPLCAQWYLVMPSLLCIRKKLAPWDIAYLAETGICYGINKVSHKLPVTQKYPILKRKTIIMYYQFPYHC